MQQRQSSPTYIVTPRGIMRDGMPLTKAASQKLPPQTLRYIKRAEGLLAKVKPGDWDNRAPHTMNNIPLLAQAQMMAALASPQPYPPLHKQRWQGLTKDAGDDADDEDDSDDTEPDSASQDEDGDPEMSSESGHYNPDEPRIPAGYRDGGQWTDGGDYSPPSTASDRASISADDVRNNPSDAVTQVGPLEPMTYETTQVTLDASSSSGTSAVTAVPVTLDDGSMVINPATGMPILMPPNVSLQANVDFGEEIKDLPSFLMGSPGDSEDLSSRETAMIAAFIWGGAMDYQRIASGLIDANGNVIIDQQYINFGNFNYGLVAAAAGYELQQSLNIAAFINAKNVILNPGSDAYGTLLGGNPRNNYFIRMGYYAYTSGKITGTGR